MYSVNSSAQHPKSVNNSHVEKSDALSKLLTPLESSVSEQINGGYWSTYAYAVPAYSAYASHQVAANHLDTLLLA